MSYLVHHRFDASVVASRMLERARDGNEYIDVHCWRFIPESFHLILSDLVELHFLNLEVVAEFPPEGCEFYITLGKTDNKPQSRQRMHQLSQIRTRISEQVDISLLPSDFDPDVYLQLNDDVRQAGLDPARHYLEFGQKEGREYRISSTE